MLYVLPGIDASTLLKELQSGMRLPNATLSTPNISHIMQSCWLADATERPSFSKTREALFDELQRETKKLNNYQDYLSRLESDLGKIQYKSIRQTNSKTSGIQKSGIGTTNEHHQTNEWSENVPKDEQKCTDDIEKPENNPKDVRKRESSLNLSPSVPFIDDEQTSIDTEYTVDSDIIVV